MRALEGLARGVPQLRCGPGGAKPPPHIRGLSPKQSLRLQLRNMIITNHSNIWRRCFLVIVLIVAWAAFPSFHFAQDARELQQERTASKKLKGEHPLLELMRTRKSALRPDLLGVHPRVYVTDKESR